MKVFYRFLMMLFSGGIVFSFTSCSNPTETKEEFIQKGIIMSDTLLKSVDKQLKDAEMAVDSAIKSGAFVPPPPPTSSPSANNSNTTNPSK
jgi:hypothetical protein